VNYNRYWDPAFTPEPGPRQHVPITDQVQRRVYMQHKAPPEGATPEERSHTMVELTKRAMEFFERQPGLDWSTITFEVDVEAVQPFGTLWRWKAWTKG
jgi:hypothetical protein